ncbi:MAG: hypothetical protein J1E98_01125 [Lachnospiraceae bacterium]|nr:hypothetical protein [Lachnospiraceae bacterium]
MKKPNTYNVTKINNEYDKFFSNTNEIKDIDTGPSMEEFEKEVDYNHKKMKLVLRFPSKEEESEDAVKIKKEVKAIMLQELLEQTKIL